MNKEKRCVISLGGSLIVPDEIDWKYLSDFHNLIIEYVEKGWNFILITGGGKTARKYQESAYRVDPDLTDEDKDWLGIHSTRLNAHLMRTIFRKYAYPRINTNPHDLEDFSFAKEPIIIAAGFRPGCSTDYDAVLLAKYLGISSLINLSNIDYVYDKDPKIFPEAKKIKETTWADFRKIVGDVWNPGLNAPFDPIAAKLSQENDLRVIIMNGKKLERLRAYLEGEAYEGTQIY
ncbi:MAG: UMP kinase [Candidatus Moraniibacteriota bacterium]|nr:MAG: UMP kinase [Candidatus Moranbacteria bacterium]